MEELSKIFTNEFRTLLLSAAALVFALLALWQRHRYHSLQRTVYQEQGIFKKPEINISLYTSNRTGYFIYALPLRDGIWEIPLRIQIVNNGQKDSEELEIQYKVNKLISWEASDEAVLKGPKIKNAKVFQYDEGSPFVTTVVTMDNLRHHQASSFDSILSIRSGTIEPHDIDVELKDGVKAIAKTWINFSLPLDVIVSQKEFGPVSRRFHLQVIDTSDSTVEEFFARYNEALRNSAPPPAKGFRERLRRMREGRDSIEKVILVMPDLTKKETRFVDLPDKKVPINQLPLAALRFQEGVYLGENSGYFIPNVTDQTKENI